MVSVSSYSWRSKINVRLWKDLSIRNAITFLTVSILGPIYLSEVPKLPRWSCRGDPVVQWSHFRSMLVFWISFVFRRLSSRRLFRFPPLINPSVSITFLIVCMIYWDHPQFWLLWMPRIKILTVSPRTLLSSPHHWLQLRILPVVRFRVCLCRIFSSTLALHCCSPFNNFTNLLGSSLLLSQTSSSMNYFMNCG